MSVLYASLHAHAATVRGVAAAEGPGSLNHLAVEVRLKLCDASSDNISPSRGCIESDSIALSIGCIPKAFSPVTPCSLWLQVMFALHDETLLSGMQLAGVTTKSVEPIHTGSSKVDIFLELFGALDGSATGHIEYDSSLWRHSSVVTMAAKLQVCFLP